MNIKNIIKVAFLIIISTLASHKASAEPTVEQSIIGLYVAYYNRAPDQGGLNYWNTIAATNGNAAALLSISEQFKNHPKFAEEYPSYLSTTEFVTKIYQNMLNRAPDTEGLNFWVTVLNNGLPKSKFIVTYVNDVLDYPGTDPAALISTHMFLNKTDVGQYYVDRLGVASIGEPGTSAYTRSIDVLACVTEDIVTVDSAKELVRNYLTTSQYIENICTNEVKSISGKIKDDDGNNVPDINIKFEYLVDGEERSTTTLTDSFGNYEIKVDGSYFGDTDTTYLIYAYKEGYVPSTKTLQIDTEDNYSVDFVINPIKVNEVVLEIEPKVHHLGDDNYSGSANSQFQKQTEGISFGKTFSISTSQYSDYGRAILRFEGKGIQSGLVSGNLISINNTSYPLLSSPSDGRYTSYTIELEKDIYKEGINNLEIMSGSGSGNYDDFEFSNIIIEFSN